MAVSTMSISDGTYASLTSPDLNVYSTLGPHSRDSPGDKSTEKIKKSLNLLRVAAVGLGLLCAILLTATIALSVVYVREGGMEEPCTHGNYKEQCDLCPESWKQFSSKCYLFSTLRASWEESLQNCEDQGATLVIINNQEEQEFISQNTRGGHYWIGLEKDPYGNFVWVDGTSLDQAFWKPVPQYMVRGSQCVRIGPASGRQLFFTLDCHHKLLSICETDTTCV